MLFLLFLLNFGSGEVVSWNSRALVNFSCRRKEDVNKIDVSLSLPLPLSSSHFLGHPVFQ